MAESTMIRLDEGERDELAHAAAHIVRTIGDELERERWSDPPPLAEFVRLSVLMRVAVECRRASETGASPPGTLRAIRDYLREHRDGIVAWLARGQDLLPEDHEDNAASIAALGRLLARADRDEPTVSEWCTNCGHTLPRGYDFGNGDADNCLLCSLIYDHRRDAQRVLLLEAAEHVVGQLDLGVTIPVPTIDDDEERRMTARDRIAWMLGSDGNGWAGNRDDLESGV